MTPICHLQLVIFGIIYSNVAKSIDNFSGLQSIVAVGFSGSLYFALFTVAFTLPNLFKERAVFYRERASNCYGPEVYALAVFIVEAPWVWFNVCCSMTVRLEALLFPAHICSCHIHADNVLYVRFCC